MVTQLLSIAGLFFLNSMHSALTDLRLDSLDVVHAGAETFPISDKVRALALARVVTDLKPL